MCQFKKITKGQIEKSSSYIVATSILNKENEFTLEEIFEDIKGKMDVKKAQEDNMKQYILKKLTTLRNNGSIVEYGSCFAVRESMD